VKIEEIISSKICPSFTARYPRLIEVIEPLPPPASNRKDLCYEKEVFNYMLKHKCGLGISNIYRLKNARADGLLRLDNGKIVLLEIKYALNCNKGSVARISFQRFMIQRIYEKLSIDRPENALIVFHQFSNLWC
jgi:hypothetical protein